MNTTFPPKKIKSVAPDATAFRSRGPQANVVMIVTWDEEDECNDISHARAMTQDFVNIIEATAEKTPTENENHFCGNLGMY